MSLFFVNETEMCVALMPDFGRIAGSADPGGLKTGVVRLPVTLKKSTRKKTPVLNNPGVITLVPGHSLRRAFCREPVNPRLG